MADIHIRQLQAQDFSDWLPLWQKYLIFYESSLSEETIRTTWERLTDDSEPMYALGAFREGRLSGFTHIIYHRSCWSVGNYCYLQDLYTLEEFRGLGIATALIEDVYVRAKAEGASRVHWLTHESNTTAQALYNKIANRSGFIQYRKILSL